MNNEAAEVPAEPRTKDYKQHLYERLQTAEQIAGYLEAALNENHAQTLHLAVTDVINAYALSAPISISEQAQRLAAIVKKHEHLFIQNRTGPKTLIAAIIEAEIAPETKP